MRLLGWILLVGGIWSIGAAVVDNDPIGLGGVAMALGGLALLTARGRALVGWIGEGVLTGLCLCAGLVLGALGTVLLLAYAEWLAPGAVPLVRSIVPPAVLLGAGLLLLVTGLKRLWRRRQWP
ncbi:MAG: hypothetical protein HY615_16545 [Candidatus Rokubacteria bacterium]|nr:hypothetical protein [Candidatus Rokubacteria bacterium]